MMEIFNPHPLSFRALALDAAFPKSLRRFFILVSLLVALGAGFLLIFPIPSLLASGRLLLGVLFAAYGFFLANILLEFFSASDLKPWPVIRRDGKVYGLGVEAARIFSHTYLLSQAAVSYKVLLEHIAQGPYFNLLLLRLGISRQDFQNFLFGHGEITQIESAGFFGLLLDVIDKKNVRTIWLSDVLTVLAEGDEPFSKFLFQVKVKKEDLAEAAEWVEFLFERERRASVWWDPENLLRIGGIGRDLGFGYTRTLDQYAHELRGDIHPFVREARKDEIQRVEEVLSRSYQANLLLVGEAGSGKHTILEGLAHRIFEGKTVPVLGSRRMVVFDYQSATAGAKTRGSYETLLIRALGEAIHAGNIILIIENFPDFLASSLSLGVNAFELLGKYISGSRMQMIALSDPKGFHRDLEPNTEIVKLFEKIEVQEPAPERALRMLEDASILIEAASGKFFTLQALKHAVYLADRYITMGAMPEKAIDLLDQVVSSLPADKKIIYPEDLETVVEKKTHIPTKKAEEEEKGKLLNLENLLHVRMINQEAAIKAVSDALRRARSGLKTRERPIGSFLFLGPTGVGKTETAKALAEIYFGREDAMVRFDMSEYSGSDGLKKLIGSRDSREPGVLASKLRERPFSLLLFDEFEKATREVHNIFLQILDEGFFSDASSKRVSARETMIIATSNAGANLIWELIQAGKDPAGVRSSVLDWIRKESFFSPELLNRFDAIVMYHPLEKAQLLDIALLLLKGLARKLKDQEITFTPSRELAQKVVEIGYDPTFGARPMRRAIADRIEQVIAKKILSGELKRGDTFSFSPVEIGAL